MEKKPVKQSISSWPTIEDQFGMGFIISMIPKRVNLTSSTECLRYWIFMKPVEGCFGNWKVWVAKSWIKIYSAGVTTYPICVIGMSLSRESVANGSRKFVYWYDPPEIAYLVLSHSISDHILHLNSVSPTTQYPINHPVDGLLCVPCWASEYCPRTWNMCTREYRGESLLVTHSLIS